MYANQKDRQGIASVLVIVPAVLLGIAAMIFGGVSPMLWGQQTAALVLVLLLTALARHTRWKIPAVVWAGMLLVILAAALFGPEAGGVRRWVKLGPFNVNAAMLVLPSMLVLLGETACFYPLLLCAAAILSIQPDASQMTALAVAAVPLLWRGRKNKGGTLLSAALLALLIIYCLRMPLAVESVPYSEGVLAMLGGISPLLAAAGCAALTLVPAFWGWRFCRERKAWQLSLAVYEAVMILFGLTGQYPVPFMGFGLSPIVGYGLFCLLECRLENV